MRPPTAWYKMGRFAGNSGYKLAFSSQVFSGTRTKLLTSPPKVDEKASLSKCKVALPFSDRHPDDDAVTSLKRRLYALKRALYSLA